MIRRTDLEIHTFFKKSEEPVLGGDVQVWVVHLGPDPNKSSVSNGWHVCVVEVLVSVWKQRRRAHRSPCCRKVRKVSLPQVPESWKSRSAHSLQFSLMLPLSFFHCPWAHVELPWLCHLKSSLIEVTTTISLTWSSSGFSENQVGVAMEVRTGANLHGDDKSTHGQCPPQWLFICALHMNVDLPTLASCFSSHCTFSLGDPLQTHGYHWPFNPCY